MGIKKLSYIQIGAESTAAKGTEVNADIIWRGMGNIVTDDEKVFPEEDVGYLSGVNRSYTPKLAATLEMEEGPATFEQAPHIFEAGIATEVATQDGAGDGYIYQYAFPTTAAPEITTYTIEGGDNVQEYQFTYGVVSDFSIAGAAEQAVTVAANWFGREADTGTKTAALSLVSVEEVLFQLATLYVDGTGDTFGTTQATNTFLEFNLNYTTGFQPVYTGDGQKYFTFEKNIGPEVLLDVMFEHDATAVTEYAAYKNGTTRMIRIDCTGSTLTSSGTVYAEKKMIIDVCGAWESFEGLDEKDGNTVVTGTLRGRYDIAAQDFGKIIVVNELTVLP